jgi:hypothetical protein
MGSAVAFGTNFNSQANSVGNGTYIGFLILTCIGILLPLAMADPKKMVRTDGTRVQTIMHPSWKSELVGLWVALRTDPYIVLLFPMFLASNWFYAWRESLRASSPMLLTDHTSQSSTLSTVPFSTSAPAH